MLALELARQLYTIDTKFRSERKNTTINTTPLNKAHILVKKRFAKNLLSLKLANLGLNLICDQWNYDSDGCIAALKITT